MNACIYHLQKYVLVDFLSNFLRPIVVQQILLLLFETIVSNQGLNHQN